ncbi:MAG: response regulator, partial [Candidatus Tectomicrobia bacterium]|nr:response regulator [Candidatus Tectomicrobia bacterium]
MLSFRNLSIKNKLQTIIMLTSGCVLLLLTAGVGVNELFTFRHGMVEQLVTLADVIGANSTAALAFNDSFDAVDNLGALRTKPHIFYARIYTNEGKVLADYVAEGQKQESETAAAYLLTSRLWQPLLDSPQRHKTQHRFRKQHLYVLHPIILDGQKTGELLLISNLQGLQEKLYQQLSIMGLVMGASLIVAFLLSSKLQRIISEPVVHLAEAMDIVSSEKNYTFRAIKQSQDELGALIDGFNAMLAQIQVRDEELERHREHLELEVSLRTAALSHAKNDLERHVLDLQVAKEKAEAASEEAEAASEKAKAASKAKSRFLAMMSHELRTPMNGVLGMTELLQVTELSRRQQRFVEMVSQSGQTMLALINRILDFSKIESGNLELDRIAFDLRQMVEETTESFAERAHKKGLEIACLIDADVPTAMYGDPLRLQQILTNLIGNALRFTEQGDIVIQVSLIEADEQTARLHLSVRDTGIGISPDAQTRIFASFSQADGSTTRKYGGTGLGLAIAKQLAEAMAGQIGVDSTPGAGSTFWFSVSLERQPAPTQTNEEPDQELQGIRVLVVTDHAPNHRVLEQHLTACRLSSDRAESASQALDMLRTAAARNTPYTVAILDRQIADTDGIELARTIKAQPDIASVHVVMLIPMGLQHDPLAVQQAGIARCLTKPVRQPHLQRCLVSVLRDPTARPSEEIPVPIVLSSREMTLQGRVLLTEDNPVNQEVTLGMLENLNCQVDIANHGGEAVAAVEHTAYDLILMDCQMPEMDGFEATRAIREREELTTQPRVPIIALTANAFDSDRKQCLASGMDDYLSKPVSLEQLHMVLARWLPARPASDASPASAKLSPPTLLQPDPAFSPVHLDHKTLENLRALQQQGRPDILQRVIQTYFANVHGLVDTLREAVSQNDATALQRTAHALKSSSGNVGALTLAAQCKELEAIGRAHDMTAAAEALAAFETEYTAVCGELEALIAISRDSGATLPDAQPSLLEPPADSPVDPSATAEQPVSVRIQDNPECSTDQAV